MATLKDIKLRMGSVKNTQQITKAMKMVAASKMRRAEERIREARPYADKLQAVVANLAGGLEEGAHPLLEKRQGGKAVVLLITSDKGLCGGLNSNLCKGLERFTHEDHDYEFLEMVCLGKKGFDFFKTRDFTITDKYRDLKEDDQIDALTQKVKELIGQYISGEINYLYIAYNHFKNVITQEVQIQQILPVVAPEKIEGQDELDFLMEPSREEILNSLLPSYVENLAFTALLDNISCEHAARMTAMDSATKNAGEMLSALQLQYNRARQAAITTELIEIISGAESL